MPTELRLEPHALLGGQKMIEIWHDGEFVGTVFASENGAGVDITTKHGLRVQAPQREGGLATVGVRIVRT